MAITPQLLMLDAIFFPEDAEYLSSYLLSIYYRVIVVLEHVD